MYTKTLPDGTVLRFTELFFPQNGHATRCAFCSNGRYVTATATHGKDPRSGVMTPGTRFVIGPASLHRKPAFLTKDINEVDDNLLANFIL